MIMCINVLSKKGLECDRSCAASFLTKQHEEAQRANEHIFCCGVVIHDDCHPAHMR